MKRLACTCSLVLLLGCTSRSTSTTNIGVDRKQLLDDLTRIVILPTYRDVDARAGDLATSVETLCSTRDDRSLRDAREAWRRMRVPWKRSEAFQLGPVVDLRIDSAVDFWPVRTADVEDVLSAEDAIDDAYIDRLGSPRKGLPVLEYLLFDASSDDAALLALLSEGDQPSRRCMYARAVARDIADQTHELLAAWEPGGGNFASELAEPTSGSTFGDTSQALSEVVSALLAHTQRTEGNRLSKPAGLQDGSVPQPESVESQLSQNSLTDLTSCIDGLESVYLSRYGGRQGVGLSDAVAQAAPHLDPIIKQQIGELRSSVAAIEPPLDRAVVDHNASVIAAHDRAKQLFRLLSADMSGALGTTPTFSDNDGD